MKKIIYISSRMKHKLKIFMLFLLLTSVGQSAYAICYVLPNTAQDIQMNIGRVLVTPNSRVGDIISTTAFTIHQVNDAWVCENGGIVYGRVKQGIPSDVDRNVWKTNIPGIGIRMYRESLINGSVHYYPHTTMIPSYLKPILSAGRFKVDIVKIAEETGTGYLSPGLYSTYYADGSGEGKPILTSHVLANSIAIVTSSCQVDVGSKNRVVNFNPVAVKQFKGIGSTAEEQEFPLVIHCSGGVAAKSPTGLSPGLVSVRFDYIPDPSKAPGVIKAEEGNESAKGISFQLINGNTLSPIANGESVYMGSTINYQQNTLTLPLKARYYQTAAKMQGGNITAVTTFTLEYN